MFIAQFISPRALDHERHSKVEENEVDLLASRNIKPTDS